MSLPSGQYSIILIICSLFSLVRSNDISLTGKEEIKFHLTLNVFCVYIQLIFYLFIQNLALQVSDEAIKIHLMFNSQPQVSHPWVLSFISMSPNGTQLNFQCSSSYLNNAFYSDHRTGIGHIQHINCFQDITSKNLSFFSFLYYKSFSP